MEVSALVPSLTIVRKCFHLFVFYIFSCFTVLFVLFVSLLCFEVNFSYLLSHTSQQRIVRLVIVLSVALHVFLISFSVYAYRRRRLLLPPTIFFNIGFAISLISGAKTEPSRLAIGKNPSFCPLLLFLTDCFLFILKSVHLVVIYHMFCDVVLAHFCLICTSTLLLNLPKLLTLAFSWQILSGEFQG